MQEAKASTARRMARSSLTITRRRLTGIEHFGELIVVQLLDTGADQQAEDEEHRKQKVPIGEKHQAADDEGRACGIEEIDCLGVREAALDQPVMDVIRIFAE